MDYKNSIGVAGVVIVLFLAFTMRQLFVGAPAVDPDHPFDVDRTFERLERILGDEAPHPVDTDANDVVRERLENEIRMLGFEPIVRDDFYCNNEPFGARCARVRNVMFWVGAPGPDAVMIASHYDSVPPGPGAADDGAGVAASLEIASILKARDLAKPVLVLMTDGEEVGLVGAASFVEKDPFAQMIGSVVSMEARGVRGPVAMFETSTPNGRDIHILDADVKKPVTSSLASDVYAAMPNGTDVTMYLTLDVDVGNYAFGDGAYFYHTPRDNLAMLDRRAVFHMGANALSAVEVFLAQDKSEPEGQWIYTDILGWFVLKAPQSFGIALIGLGGLGALLVFMVKGGGAPLRSAVFPLVAIVLGVGLAVGATMLIGVMRPEANFAAAHPWALRGAHNAAALLGAAIALVLLARPGAENRMAMAGWFWFACLGTAVSAFFPGGAIIFAPALAIILVAAAFALFGQSFLSRLAAFAAVLVYMVIVVPSSALGETMLFVESAAPFTLFVVFAFAFLAPPFLPDEGLTARARWLLPAGVGAVFVAFIVAALLGPAYSTDAPRGLSVVHSAGADPGEASWSVRTSDPLPEAMTAVAAFERREVYGLGGVRYAADAPAFETAGLEAQIVRNETVGDERIVAIEIAASDSDRVQGGLLGEGLEVKSIEVNGSVIDEAAPSQFACFGRACRMTTVTIRFEGGGPEPVFDMQAYRYGLGPESAALISARPDWALPQHTGDIRALSATLEIPQP